MAAILDAVKAYLPPAEGVLPYWLLLFGVVAIGNSVQCYVTMHFTERIYSGPAPLVPYKQATPSAPKHDLSRTRATPLQARTFATWTFMAAVIRVYAAYHIHERAFYELAFMTYTTAWLHFMSEWFVFGSCHWGAPIAGPVIGSSVSLVWMWLQWGAYVKA